MKSDNKKVKRARSVCLGVLKVASGLCPRPPPWEVPAAPAARQSPSPPPPPEAGGEPPGMEALPTALISGHGSYAIPSPYRADSAPVTYRLRDNSPMLSPPLQRRLLLHQEFPLLPAPSIPPNTPPRLWQVRGSSPPRGLPGPRRAGMPPHRPQPQRCSPPSAPSPPPRPRYSARQRDPASPNPCRAPAAPRLLLLGWWGPGAARTCSSGTDTPTLPTEEAAQPGRLAPLPTTPKKSRCHLLLLLAVFPPSLHLPRSPCGNCLTALHKKCTCPLGYVTAADGQAASIAPARARAAPRPIPLHTTPRCPCPISIAPRPLPCTLRAAFSQGCPL